MGAECCSTIESQLDVIESKADAITCLGSCNTQPLANTLTSCCSAIDQQLSVIDADIGHITCAGSCNTAPLMQALTGCCSAVESQLEFIESKIEAIGGCTCEATAIHQSDIPKVITVAGAYCLAEDVTVGASANGITVNVPFVSIDLSGRTIQGGMNGIVINADHVMIRNGTVRDASNANIGLMSNNCLIEQCDLVNSALYGVQMFGGTRNRIYDCCALNNGYAGFSLSQSFTNNVIRCKAVGNGIDEFAFGFFASQGGNNLFEACKAEGTHAAYDEDVHIVAGFYLNDEHIVG